MGAVVGVAVTTGADVAVVEGSVTVAGGGVPVPASVVTGENTVFAPPSSLKPSVSEPSPHDERRMGSKSSESKHRNSRE